MLEKFEILIIIFFLLLTFYLVIFWGARKKGGIPQSGKIKNYLFGVRILITIIGLVALILWSFL